MNRFYNVYVRLAGAAISAGAMALGNVLEGFDKLDLPQVGTKFTVEPVLTELGDGTSLVDSETANLETGTHRVDSAEYGWLRSTFHNKLCDVMLYDPNDNMIVALVYGMKLNVTKLLESGASTIIKLFGKRTWNSANVSVLQPEAGPSYGVLSGRIYKEDGVTPVVGANISIRSGGKEYKDITDKDGEYIIMLPEGTVTYTPVKAGLSFIEATVKVDSGRETVQDFVAYPTMPEG